MWAAFGNMWEDWWLYYNAVPFWEGMLFWSYWFCLIKMNQQTRNVWAKMSRKNLLVFVNTTTCLLKWTGLQSRCQFLREESVLSMIVIVGMKCVVPENIHTFPMEGIFSKNPLPCPTPLEIWIKLHTFL